MENKFKGIRVEFHILQSFPVSCLNRDDLGSPKSAMIGGVPRARVSSQCWKRAVRLAMHELGIQTAQRTKYVVRTIAEKCEKLGATAEQAIQCGEWTAKAFSSSIKDGKSATLFFISDSEAAGVAAFFHQRSFECPNIESEGENEKKTKRGKGKNDSIVKNFYKEIHAACKNAINPARDGLDIALFGRMVADATDLNVEAAASFAHAISTHRVDPEIDFFTAVDDCKAEGESGSAHMGSLEFNSATYYRYVSLDLGQLAETLKSDDITSAVEAFAKALFLAVPAARQATMSAANLWNYALVTIRKGQRLQLGFNTAVRTSVKEPDIVANSIKALQEQFANAERMTGSLFGLREKYEICLEKGSIDELIAMLKSDISKIEA